MDENKFGEPWILYPNDGEIEYEKIGERTYCKWSEFLYEHIMDRICACVNACAGMDNPEKELAERDAEIAHLKEYNRQLFEANAANVQRGTPEVVSLINEIARLKADIIIKDVEIERLKSIVGLSSKMFNDTANIAEQLLSDNAALRAVLEKHEWRDCDCDGYRCQCFECGNEKPQGHAPGCEIARLLQGGKP